jgi:A/G-specific adenine glycosylase
LLGAMAGLPGSDWTGEAPKCSPRAISTVTHTFTHFRLELQVERRENPVGDGWWQPIDQLDHAGLPTLFRRVAEVALAAVDEPRAAA